MLRLRRGQRVALGETVRQLANLAAGALVLGQFLGAQPLSWSMLLAGTAVWIVFVSFALMLIGEE